MSRQRGKVTWNCLMYTTQVASYHFVVIVVLRELIYRSPSYYQLNSVVCWDAISTSRRSTWSPPKHCLMPRSQSLVRSNDWFVVPFYSVTTVLSTDLRHGAGAYDTPLRIVLERVAENCLQAHTCPIRVGVHVDSLQHVSVASHGPLPAR